MISTCSGRRIGYLVVRPPPPSSSYLPPALHAFAGALNKRADDPRDPSSQLLNHQRLAHFPGNTARVHESYLLRALSPRARPRRSALPRDGPDAILNKPTDGTSFAPESAEVEREPIGRYFCSSRSVKFRSGNSASNCSGRLEIPNASSPGRNVVSANHSLLCVGQHHLL